MNILFLSTHLDIGGITWYILTLSRGYIKEGHSVFVASGGGSMEERFRGSGVTLLPLAIRTKQEFGPKAFRAMPQLCTLLKEQRIDIIHSNSRVTQVVAQAASRLTHVPHVTTYHGFFRKRTLRRILPCIGERVIAISTPVKDYLLRDLGIPEKKISLIHNGVDTARFSERPAGIDPQALRREYGLRGDSTVVGIIARLSTVKGHEDLITAFAAALASDNRLELLIVGEGDIKPGLVQLAKKLGVDDSVRYVDRVDDTRRPLSVIDIFAMPSHMEGFGLAVLEAMMMEKAVVATDIGGISEVVENNSTGILVPPRSPSELATAILRFAGNPDLRAEFGRRARAAAAARFPLDATISKTLELYTNVVAKG
ncbi:MAG TPA: glycosyltransferase family 4 protein [bacterium]|nr:glycosyltransferase family 4 protein [bacterium]